MQKPPPYTSDDFAHSPFVMFYELTRACNLVCKHCRACAQPNRHPNELVTEQSKRLLDQIASFPKRPVVVFTGGDPMKRDDVFELVRYGTGIGLTIAMTPSATPLVTPEALRGLKDAGLSRLAVSLDAVDPVTHDGFRGVQGSYARTLEIIAGARKIGLTVQVNTTITRRNVFQVDEMAELLGSLGIVLWSVFFLVPVGRGLMEERILPEQYEMVFEKLWHHAERQPYAIKTTEAHHYRRFVLQRQGDPQRQGNPQRPAGQGPAGQGLAGQRTDSGVGGAGTTGSPDRIRRAPIGVNDGKGVMFVSHTGSVYPSGFMPILCGKFPQESIVDIYQKSALFQSLRDGNLLTGKCGACEYRGICGGSRARAYQVTGSPLEAEPDCVYVPQAWREAKQEELTCLA